MSTDLAPAPVAHRVTRVLLAALRLGAIYAIGVTALFLLVVVGLNAGAIPILEVMTRIWIPATAIMIFAFAMLAVARGVGFLLLWGLALLVWVLMLQVPPLHAWLESEFLLWSVFAAPLSAMLAVGRPESVTTSRRVSLLRRSMTIAWVVLAACAMLSEMAAGEYVSVPVLPLWLSDILYPFWIVLPFVIGVDGVLRALELLRARTTRAA